MQKYQVFIKQHQLSLVEKAEKYEQFETTMFITSPQAEEFKIMVEGMFTITDPLKLQFVVANPSESWQEFKASFLLIQAAGGRVVNTKGEMLWIKRLGKWDLPKGKIEKGETVELAAVREVEEECGISHLQIKATLPSTYHMYKLEGQTILKETFWFEMETSDQADLIPQEEEAIEAAVWVDQNDLSEKLANTYPSISSLFST
jgi:8-oxo-dGTP pyrophosphatase MutT (NUDIX family)